MSGDGVEDDATPISRTGRTILLGLGVVAAATICVFLAPTPAHASDGVEGLVGGLVGTLTEKPRDGVSNVQNLATSATSSLESVLDPVVSPVVGVLDPVVSPVIEIATPVVTPVLDPVSTVVKEIVTPIVDNVPLVGDVVRELDVVTSSTPLDPLVAPILGAVAGSSGEIGSQSPGGAVNGTDEPAVVGVVGVVAPVSAPPGPVLVDAALGTDEERSGETLRGWALSPLVSLITTQASTLLSTEGRPFFPGGSPLPGEPGPVPGVNASAVGTVFVKAVLIAGISLLLMVARSRRRTLAPPPSPVYATDSTPD